MLKHFAVRHIDADVSIDEESSDGDVPLLPLVHISHNDRCMLRNLEIRFRSNVLSADGFLDEMRQAMRDDMEVLNADLRYGEFDCLFDDGDEQDPRRTAYADDPLSYADAFQECERADEFAAAEILEHWIHRQPPASRVVKWKRQYAYLAHPCTSIMRHFSSIGHAYGWIARGSILPPVLPSIDDTINLACAPKILDEDQVLGVRTVLEQFERERGELQRPPPLGQIVIGPAGTGKSLVVNAIRSHFSAYGESAMLVLAAFTGKAASLIGGRTLHDVGLMGRPKNQKDHQDEWTGVRFLIIDEISMISCANLAHISQSLCRATGKDAPFGGLNVIVFGDFSQLPPMPGPSLVKAKSICANPASSCSADSMSGADLWVTFFTACVILKTVWRQSNDRAYLGLLEGLLL